jgi:hypothetical protein
MKLAARVLVAGMFVGALCLGVMGAMAWLYVPRWGAS